MVRILSARSLILRIIAASSEADSSSTLTRLAAELKKLQSEVIPSLLQKFIHEGKDKTNSVIVPTDAVERLREAYSSEQLVLIAQLADSLANSSYLDRECIQFVKNSLCLQTPSLPDQNKPASYKKFLLRISTCSETLAFIGAICTSAASQIKPNILKKKNKRKNTKDPIVSTAVEDQVSKNIFFILKRYVPVNQYLFNTYLKCRLYG